MHVKDQKSQSVSEYAGDAATTSSVKAKLLADGIVPSRKIKVETTDGVVQLSGDVENKAQSERAESIAKAVNGVKALKRLEHQALIIIQLATYGMEYILLDIDK